MAMDFKHAGGSNQITGMPPAMKPEDRVPAVIKLAWSSGAVFENVMVNAVSAWVNLIFNLGFLINPIWLGWGQTIPRLLDAILDPLYGYWSDNTQTRWGRRRPWMLGSAIFGAIVFVLLWFPSAAWSPVQIFLWFLVFSILCYQAYGIFAISYNALGMELTPDYNERTRVQAWRFVFLTLSGLMLNAAYKMSFLPLFAIGKPEQTDHPEIYGIRGVALLFSLIILLCALAPVIFCRERKIAPVSGGGLGGKAGQEKIKLGAAFRFTLGNRVFIHYLAILACGLLGALVLPFHNYLVIYHVCGGNKVLGGTYLLANATVSTVLGIASVPLINWIATRYGKIAMLSLGQAVLIPGALLTWWLFNPAVPWLFMIYNLVAAMSLGGLLMLYNSVLVDICDLDEIKTRQRREGMYGAVTAVAIKTIFSISTVLVGYLLVWAGFNEKLGVQTVETLSKLRFMVAVCPAFMAVCAVVLLWKFPLTKARALAVRSELEARRGALHEVETT
jgi:GPH family glycoside/pentoside/hexuronide:cation symporter